MSDVVVIVGSRLLWAVLAVIEAYGGAVFLFLLLIAVLQRRARA